VTLSNVNQLKSPITDLEQHLDQGFVNGPLQADVDFFNASMRPEPSMQQSNVSEQIASALSDGLGSIDKLSQQAARRMKRASTTDDPLEISQMNRSLSQYSLQIALTTKVVSKSAQALDKLTNLQ
jgi:type III secretion system YscI/HrpB-like protein